MLKFHIIRKMFRCNLVQRNPFCRKQNLSLDISCRDVWYKKEFRIHADTYFNQSIKAFNQSIKAILIFRLLLVCENVTLYYININI